jgi:hypothetical protein
VSRRDDTTRFFFVHLQKTAGTSLLMRMRKNLGRHAVYPGLEDKGDVASVLSVDHLLRRWREADGRIRVVTGHFPLCTAELLGGDFVTLTILREPVERTLSYLRHHRELAGDERSLEEIYADPFRFNAMIHNHMVKMLSLTTAEMTNGMLTEVSFTRERLERAQANLARVDLVGIQERFEDFCAELSRRFDVRLGAPQYANRSRPVEVPEALRARIARDNELDTELYEFARGLVAERSRAS